MGKFEVELELQGLKVRMRGERQEIPMLAANLRDQLAGMFEPVANVADGTAPKKRVENTAPHIEHAEPTPSPQRRRTKRPSQLNGTTQSTQAIDWVNDPEKWGSPRQEWTTLKKSIWLLYVAREAAGAGELSSGQIAATFNKHFREAKPIRPQNVTRDLRNAKGGVDSLVSENTTKHPSTWFLTNAGRAQAQRLIAEARGIEADGATS